jgi:hypothetical protein
MSTNLCFYKSTIPSSNLLMQQYYYKCLSAGVTLTLKNVNGVSNADLGTYIGTLTDGTYTEIKIFSPCESTANSTATDTLNLANQYALRAKLITASQGTYSTESAVADTYSATTIGNTGMAEVNALVGTPDSPIYVVLSAGTGSGQLSTIKSNTADVATIHGTFYAVPDGTTKHKILTDCKLHVVGSSQIQSATVTKTRAEIGWESMYPAITLPVINSYYAGVPGYALKTSTNTSACGAATLTDTSLSAGTTEWVGMWVVIYDATAYGYQYGQILSHSTTVATLTKSWSLGTPTGTGKVYRIYAREKDCLKDIYFQLWMQTNMTLANSNSTHLANLAKLIDANGNLANGTAVRETFQDLAYLSDCLATGKTYLDFVRGGASVAIPT